jgi:multisubunit Na+/H+ antiporter MnhC subunit
MIQKFLYLEWKAFIRSASFATNLALKILMGFVAAYFILIFLALGVLTFYILKKENFDPIVTVNKFLIYYVLIDLVIRLLLQKIPVMNIRPMLVFPIKKSTIVHFSLGKTILSFFNLVHGFFLIPFCVVLIIEGYDALSVVLWFTAVYSLLYCNNFINIILSNKDNLFAIFLGIVAVLGGLQYYGLFSITDYTAPFFNAIFNTYWAFAIPILVLFAFYYVTFHYFKNNLYLDAGLSNKHDIATTEDLTWLNQFGTIGTFLKNDIKLIKRNKRSKTTVGLSVMFLFYGFLFFTNGIAMYNNPVMHIFAGIFVSGGFLITFGQFVPSWDSAYYQLMMTQNIPYKGYLSSKWWLMVIATVITTTIASFYLYFGVQVYLTIVVGALYNIGVNSHLVLLGGAYTKTPIDLSSGKGAFGDKKAFNIKTMLISIPQLSLPVLLYWLGSKYGNPTVGLVLVASAGVIGFAFKEKAFSVIEKIYKSEKYATIAAYKQKG